MTARTQTTAIAAAMRFNGKTYPIGRCQAFVCVDVFNTGAVGDYDGDKAADAEDGWKKAVAVGKVVKVPTGMSAMKLAAWMKGIPGGLPMYWTGGSHDNGHAATSLPAGKLFTTDKTYASSTRGVCGIVANTWPHTHWGLTFVGYVLEDGNGHNLLDDPNAPAPVFPEASGGKYAIGSSGDYITELGKRVVPWSAYLGLPKPYDVGPGPTFTETDRVAVQRIQLKWWPTGSTKVGGDCDGFPGAEFLKRIAVDPPAATATPKPTTPTFRLARAVGAAPTALPKAMQDMYHVPPGTPYPDEDSVPGLELALAKKRAWTDIDIHVTQDKVMICGHDTSPSDDGFIIPADVKKKYGSHPNIENMPWSVVSKLRTKSGQRYYTVEEIIAWLGVHLALSVAFEMKQSKAFEDPATFEDIYDLCIKYGVDPSRIAIMSIARPAYNHLARFKAAHLRFRTVVLPHGLKKPAAWPEIQRHVDNYRGSWG